MSSRPGIETVVIAAGLSQRMGGVNKLLLPVAGVPMVRQVVARHAAVAEQVVVVTGHDEAMIKGALAGLDITIVHNPDFAAGQPGSVAAGVAAVRLTGRGLMIGLGDQPCLTVRDLEALVDAFDADGGTRVCVPEFAGERGNPVLFPTGLVREMRHDGRSPGCRRFIAANPDRVCRVPVDNNHFTTDIDTSEDARRILGVAVSAAA